MKWTDLNLSALQYFVDTITTGSVTKAAEKNHVSRPAISQAIRRLETVIGYDLLVHSKNSLQLTREGKLFFQKAQISLEFFCNNLSHSEQGSGQMRIASSATLAEFLILPAIKRLKVTFAEPVRLQIGTSAKVRQLISDGEARLGFIIEDGKTYGFESHVVGRGSFVLRSSSGSFRPPLITTESRPEVEHLQKILRKSGFFPTPSIQIDGWSSCRKAAELYSGTCLLPDLIPVHPLKPVRDLKYQHPYELKAIFLSLNSLSEIELQLLRMLKES